MNRPVSPAPASSGNPFCAAVSSTRTAVLPTATIRPPAAGEGDDGVPAFAGGGHAREDAVRQLHLLAGPHMAAHEGVPAVRLFALPYQQHLHLAPARPLVARQARGNDLRVVEDDQVVRTKQRGELSEMMVSQRAGTPIHDEEPGTVAGLDWMLGDQGLVEGIVEVLQPH